MKLCLYQLLCVLTMLGRSLSAHEIPIFSKLDKSDGISNNTVYNIVQDSSGYLWIATANGLNRFDGKEFIVYITNY